MYDVRMSKTHAALVLSVLILLGSASYTVHSWDTGVETQRPVTQEMSYPPLMMMPAEDLMVGYYEQQMTLDDSPEEVSRVVTFVPAPHEDEDGGEDEVEEDD